MKVKKKKKLLKYNPTNLYFLLKFLVVLKIHYINVLILLIYFKISKSVQYILKIQWIIIKKSTKSSNSNPTPKFSYS